MLFHKGIGPKTPQRKTEAMRVLERLCRGDRRPGFPENYHEPSPDLAASARISWELPLVVPGFGRLGQDFLGITMNRLDHYHCFLFPGAGRAASRA